MTENVIDNKFHGATDLGDNITLPDEKQPKRKKERREKGHEITTRTIKTPVFSYACLELIPDPPRDVVLDELTVRTHLTSALTQFLGIMGAAISIDIIKVDGRECWIRVPREDLRAMIAAAGGWTGGNERDGQVGWNVKKSGNWLGSLAASADIDKVWTS